jgi:hypothetical protein
MPLEWNVITPGDTMIGSARAAGAIVRLHATAIAVKSALFMSRLPIKKDENYS